MRYVIDLIRKKRVPEAQAILNGSPRRASGIVRKLLNQALDAAEKNSQVAAKDLLVSKVTADGGPSMKRFRAASMGRASVIQKRSSHIHLELDLIKKGVGVPKKQETPTAKKSVAPAKGGAASGGKDGSASGGKKTNKKLIGAK